MVSDEFVVYRSWPQEVINDAISEFNKLMHNGGEIEELRAGLHGLDFLTRGSVVDGNTQGRLDGCIMEAEMRIELYTEADNAVKSHEEMIDQAVKACQNLLYGIRSVQRMIKTRAPSEEYVQEYVRKIVQERMNNK